MNNNCPLSGYYRSIYIKEREMKPNDFNQMFIWFGESIARFDIVDLERTSDTFKDIMVNYQYSTYNLLQNDTVIQFGTQTTSTCNVNIGIFSPKSQSVISYGCSKWIHYVRAYSYSFSELEDNCTRISLQSESLSMILERSEIPYPLINDNFHYDFMYNENNYWFVSNPEPNLELFIKFTNVSKVEKSYNRHDLLIANYEMIIQNSEGASQIKGKVEIFTKFSVLSSNIETCLESNKRCKLCTTKYVQSLYGQLNTYMNGTLWSVQNYPNFSHNGQSPNPFHPIIVVSSSSPLLEEENLAIIICASIGGVLFVLFISFIVVGLVYLSRRRSMKPVYVPLK